jgi:heptaprenyl diphosphate synthase
METQGPVEGQDHLSHYLGVVADKTGSLIAASARFGAMVSGAPDEIKETLTVFGEKIGVAFQLVDDVIDIASESFESGKTPGTDLREGVPTLVTLNVIAMNRPEDRELIALLQAPIKNEQTVASVIKTLRAHPALELSRLQTIQYAQDARTALGPLPINEVTAALYSLCDAIIDRTR